VRREQLEAERKSRDDAESEIGSGGGGDGGGGGGSGVEEESSSHDDDGDGDGDGDGDDSDGQDGTDSFGAPAEAGAGAESVANANSSADSEAAGGGGGAAVAQPLGFDVGVAEGNHVVVAGVLVPDTEAGFVDEGEVAAASGAKRGGEAAVISVPPEAEVGDIEVGAEAIGEVDAKTEPELAGAPSSPMKHGVEVASAPSSPMKHGVEVDATVGKATTEVELGEAAPVAVHDGPDGKSEVAPELKAEGASSLGGESEMISEVEAEGAAAVGKQSGSNVAAEGGVEGVGVAEAADDMHKCAETNAGGGAQTEGLPGGAPAERIADAEQELVADEAAPELTVAPQVKPETSLPADAQFGDDLAVALEADIAGGDAAATLPLTDRAVAVASSSIA
jgi:hypothetical protein